MGWAQERYPVVHMQQTRGVPDPIDFPPLGEGNDRQSGPGDYFVQAGSGKRIGPDSDKAGRAHGRFLNGKNADEGSLGK
jgi:hypothetical protein